MRVALAQVRSVAPSVGWPAHKSSLIRRLREEGAEPRRGAPARGGAPFEFDLEGLPRAFHAPLSDLLNAPAGMEPKRADPPVDKRHIKAPPSLRIEAERRWNMVWRVRRLIQAGRTERQACIVAADEFGKSLSATKGAWRIVRARPDAEWLDALVPSYKGRAKAPVDERIVRLFISDFGRVEKPEAQACYERTCRVAKANGWGDVPSLKTLQRRFEDLPPDVKRLMREGERSLLDSLPHQERDRSHMLALDSINMDSRTWDLFAQLDDGRVIRPVVTVAQDEATNFILAYEVTETETAASYRRVLCQAFTRWGIPDKVRFDNTRAAANKALTAGAKHRYRFKDDGLVDGLLKRLGCEVAFTEPYNGKAKLVERCFADLKQRTEKHPRLAGAYAGRSPVEKPANYGERAVPIAVFMEVLAEGIEEYNTRTGRRSTVAWKTSHQAVFEAGLQKIAPKRLTEDQGRLFFYVAERRTVTPSGTVTLGAGPRPHRYAIQALRVFAGSEIVVRFDENDMAAPIVAETLDGVPISDEVPRIAAGAFDDVEAAKAHRRERRKVVRAAKDMAAGYARMDAIEFGDAAVTVESPAPKPAPEAAVIRGVFRRRPAPNPATPARVTFDAERAEAAERLIRPETRNTGFDPDRAARGDEWLNSVRLVG